MILLNVLLFILLWNIIVSNINKKYKHSNRVFCGLIAYSGPDPFNIDIIKTLLYISSIERGTDSTGTYTPEDGVIKSISPGWQFSTSDDLKLTPSTTFIGHVRAKTRGVVSEKNAHPFHRGNCILAHNGTLTNSYDLRMKYDLSFNDYDVDSDILCGSLAKAKNIDPIKEIEGAAALLIIDTEDPETLFIYRKGDTLDANLRPLYRGSIGNNTYICSIKEALLLVNCTNVKEFKVDNMYTIKRGVYTKDPFKIKNKPYKHFTPIVTTNNSNNSTSGVQSVPNKQAVGSYLRANTSFYVTNSNGDTLRIIENEYYLVTNCIAGYKYVIQNPLTLEEHNVYESRFIAADIIKDGNWVRPLEDDILTTGKHKTPCKKDVPVKVCNSFLDGDLSLNCTGLNNTTYIKKIHFKKLTNSELNMFLSTGQFIENKDDSGATVTRPITTSSSALLVQSASKMDNKAQMDLINFLESTNPTTEVEVETLNDIITGAKRENYEKLELVYGDFETIRILHSMFNELNSELETLKVDCDDFYVDNVIKDRVNALNLTVINSFNKLLKIRKNGNSTV